MWGWSERMLALLDSAAASGTEVSFEIYPDTAYRTCSDLMFPAWALAGGRSAFLLADDAMTGENPGRFLTRAPRR